MKQKIAIEQGDITKLAVDCIVNAANESLLGGGGVDGAIHAAAGPELLAECRTLHGCRTGEAKITKGYRLKAKYVIHTVGPIYSGSARDAILLKKCYVNSLELARKNGIHSIAFPAIATGVYGYPLREAVTIAYDTVGEWLSKNNDYKMQVIFSCFDARTFLMYKEKLENEGNDIRKSYRVLRIDEQDFGCEGRPDDTEPMVDVTLQAKDGTKQIFPVKDLLLYQRNIKEGDEVFVKEGHLYKKEDEE